MEKRAAKGCGLWKLGAPVSEAVCLWSALSASFYSLGLSPPGFAENVLVPTLLCPDRSWVRRYRCGGDKGRDVEDAVPYITYVRSEVLQL
jgi:hypothetical protein